HGQVGEVDRPREAVDLRLSREGEGPERRTLAPGWLHGHRRVGRQREPVPAIELGLEDPVGRAVVLGGLRPRIPAGFTWNWRKRRRRRGGAAGDGNREQAQGSN